jgi:hypothetical protein
MSNELIRRTLGLPAQRDTLRAIAQVGGAVQVEQAIIRGKGRVGEFAIHEVMYLKGVQRELESRNPDAADAIALIVNVTISAIAREVAQFGSELGR